eukprot:2615521-Rhodomonas_salina.2
MGGAGPALGEPAADSGHGLAAVEGADEGGVRAPVGHLHPAPPPRHPPALNPHLARCALQRAASRVQRAGVDRMWGLEREGGKEERRGGGGRDPTGSWRATILTYPPTRLRQHPLARHRWARHGA